MKLGSSDNLGPVSDRAFIANHHHQHTHRQGKCKSTTTQAQRTVDHQHLAAVVNWADDGASQRVRATLGVALKTNAW